FSTQSDWLGRVASLTYPDGEVVSYGYDALGRASSLSSNQAGNIAQLAYNALSQITTLNMGNGVQVSNTYHSATSRLLNRSAGNGQETLMDFSYEYDTAGNIIAMQDAVL